MPRRVPEIELLEAWAGAGDGVAQDKRDEWANEILAPVEAYPQQWDIGRAIWKRSRHQSIKGSRRCGKSSLYRVLLAMVIAESGCVVRIMTGVLHGPTANFLARPQDGGALRILMDLGLWTPGSASSIATVGRSGRSVVEITFPWDSGFYVHDIADAGKVDKHHGITASYYWFDEASKLPPGMLQHTMRDLVNPTLVDHAARVLMTYTPDDHPGSVTTRLAMGDDPEWQHSEMASWRNVAFGDTFAERWRAVVDRTIRASRADYALRDEDIERLADLTEAECDAVQRSIESPSLKEWIDELDPALLRNIFGRQVFTLSSYVYDWHRVDPLALYWCATSEATSLDGGLRVAATLEERVAWLLEHPDLQSEDPEIPMGWRVVLGVDIGERPDPWATTAWAWSRYCSTAYELHSEAENDLGDDGMLQRTWEVANRVTETGLPISVLVADVTGMRAGTGKYWQREFAARFPKIQAEDGTMRSMRVVAPRKGPKLARIRRFNIDLVAQRYAIVSGSQLDLEGRHLRYHPTKPGVVHKHREIPQAHGRVIVPGDNCLDTTLYAGDEIGTLRARPMPVVSAPVSAIQAAHAKWRSKRKSS